LGTNLISLLISFLISIPIQLRQWLDFSWIMFISYMVCLKSIVSDRDRIFMSNSWKELFSLAQVKLSMSSAYHPQSDGPIERVNQCLETFLRCFVTTCPKKEMG
jgi:hypothetical protein